MPTRQISVPAGRGTSLHFALGPGENVLPLYEKGSLAETEMRTRQLCRRKCLNMKVGSREIPVAVQGLGLLLSPAKVQGKGTSNCC